MDPLKESFKEPYLLSPPTLQVRARLRELGFPRAPRTQNDGERVPLRGYYKGYYLGSFKGY